MPVITRARSSAARVTPYAAASRQSSTVKRDTSPQPSPNLSAVEQVPTLTRRPRAVRETIPAHSPPAVKLEPREEQRPSTARKFRWTWSAERKLLVNLVGVRLPLSEAAYTRLADLFNGPSPEDVRVRVELLQGQRDVSLAEDAEAAESTAPTEEAVEMQQPAAEEANLIDLDWSDTSSLSSVPSDLSEVEGGRSPTFQSLETPGSPDALSSLSRSRSPSPSPSPSPHRAPRPEAEPEVPAPNWNGSPTSPSSGSSTPAPPGSSISSSQSTPGPQPILLADGRPLRSILKTCRGGSGARAVFDLSKTEVRVYEMDDPDGKLLHDAGIQTTNRKWAPVDNACWEQSMLKRTRDEYESSNEQREAKRVCTAGHLWRNTPNARPIQFPAHQSTFPTPVRAVAAVAASQEWQDSDAAIPRSMGRRSVMEYPLCSSRQEGFFSPTQFSAFAPNTPNANSVLAQYKSAPTAEEEEQKAFSSPIGANDYVPLQFELSAVGHSGRHDESPDPAPRTIHVESLSAADDETEHDSFMEDSLMESFMEDDSGLDLNAYLAQFQSKDDLADDEMSEDGRMDVDAANTPHPSQPQPYADDIVTQAQRKAQLQANRDAAADEGDSTFFDQFE